jgi:acetyltransferase-like isoleucine patch superfamily enzyme
MNGVQGSGQRAPLRDRKLSGLRNRLLQVLSLYAPGGDSVRASLHRRRGVHVGDDTFIGMNTIIETAFPGLVSIGSRVDVGMRVTIIAHQVGEPDPGGVTIEDDAFIGPCSLILPNVTIGAGAVVAAGSVVTRSVPPLTLVRGNPATPVARCAMPLARSISLREFYRQLRPIKNGAAHPQPARKR